MSNEIKVQFSEQELRKMKPEDRKALFGGKDPFEQEEKKGFSFSGMSVGMAFVLAILLILVTAITIQYIIQPEIAPPIEYGSFELPLEENHPAYQTEIFEVTAGNWNQANFTAFISSADRLAENPTLSNEIPARKELYLYKLKAFIFTEQYDKGREFARFIQSRYPDDYTFMSDVFYYRGHIILNTDGHAEAYGAFREAHILGGRYEEEAGRAMNNIERMTRPIW